MELPNYLFKLHATAPGTRMKLPNLFFNFHDASPTVGCEIVVLKGALSRR